MQTIGGINWATKNSLPEETLRLLLLCLPKVFKLDFFPERVVTVKIIFLRLREFMQENYLNVSNFISGVLSFVFSLAIV